MRLTYHLLNLWSRTVGILQRLPPPLGIPLQILLALAATFVYLVLAIPWWLFRVARGVWFRFVPVPAARNISRREGDGADVDAASKTVQDDG